MQLKNTVIVSNRYWFLFGFLPNRKIQVTKQGIHSFHALFVLIFQAQIFLSVLFFKLLATMVGDYPNLITYSAS